MKTLTRISILTFCAASSLTLAWAGTALPRGVYPLSDLDKAKTEAAAKNTPIIFVHTEMESSCPLCASATDDIFKSFRSRGTIVLLEFTSDDLKNAPQPVTDLRMKPAMGNTYPMVMVTNSSATKGLKGYSYEELKDGKAGKAARELRKSLEGVDMSAGASNEATTTTQAAKPNLMAEEQTWRNIEGKSITAAVKQVGESSVTFVMPGGKTVDYPLAKLSEESRSKLNDLRK